MLPGTNQSTSIQFINGRMTSTRSFIYTLMPNKEGTLTIPAMTFNLNGKNYTTQKIQIEVTQAPPLQTQPQQPGRTPQPVQPSGNLDNDIFLRVIPEKKSVYLNEGITVTYKLYTAVQVTSYGISKSPTAQGFWVEEYPIPSRPPVTTEILKGRQFQVATLKKIEVFPTKTGELTIDPLIMEAEVRVRVQQNPRSIFDDFFSDSFFGRTVRKSLSSGPVTINVVPLPNQNKPPDFTNTVGDFSLTANVEKTEVITNEAVTLTVSITGTGNIKFLKEPLVEVSGDFEKYPPNTKEAIRRENDVISGSKTFEYVLIPRFPGEQRISPISLSYFNPKTKKYTTKKTPEIIVHVSPGEERFPSSPGIASRGEIRLVGSDIRFIKVQAQDFYQIGHTFYSEITFIISMIFPLFLIGGAVIVSRYRERLSSDVAFRRNRQAHSNALKWLREAEKYLNSPQSREKFFSSVAGALQGFIADKLNVSEAGLLTDEVSAQLKNRTVKQKTIEQFLKILHTCDYSRFAPSTDNIADMKLCLKESKEVIAQIEKEMK